VVFFLQQLVSGISIGSIYALLAVGYALVYSVYNFTNWAFDAFMVTGAFAAFYGISLYAMPFPVAIAFSIVMTVALALVTETVAYRPLRAHNAPRLFMMISAMGASLAVVNIANLAFGGSFRKFPEITAGAYRLGGVSVGRMDLFAAGFACVMLCLLWLFLERTKFGLGVRASALDTVTAGIMGVNNNQVALIIFGISGGRGVLRRQVRGLSLPGDGDHQGHDRQHHRRHRQPARGRAGQPAAGDPGDDDLVLHLIGLP